MSKCLECGAEIKQTEGRRPRKFCDNKGKCRLAHWNKNNKGAKRKTVSLPIDFVKMNKIGILRGDGTIEELKTIDQLPSEMTESWKSSIRAIQDLKNDTSKISVEHVTPKVKEEAKHPLYKEATKEPLTEIDKIRRKKLGW